MEDYDQPGEPIALGLTPVDRPPPYTDCFNIPIIDDLEREPPEMFMVELVFLSPPLFNISLEPNVTTVIILDNDGLCMYLI